MFCTFYILQSSISSVQWSIKVFPHANNEISNLTPLAIIQNVVNKMRKILQLKRKAVYWNGDKKWNCVFSWRFLLSKLFKSDVRIMFGALQCSHSSCKWLKVHPGPELLWPWLYCVSSQLKLEPTLLTVVMVMVMVMSVKTNTWLLGLRY